MTAQIGTLSRDSPDAQEDTAAVLHLIFRTDGREHALAIEHVIEVVRMVAFTRMPEAPPWVSGVINFRGRVIPLVDVRVRLGAPRLEPDLSTPIVVVNTRGEVAGLVVDEVIEVLPIRNDEVDPPGPASSASPGSAVLAASAASAAVAAVSGVARVGDRLILVVDRDRLCDGSNGLGLPTDIEEHREAGS